MNIANSVSGSAGSTERVVSASKLPVSEPVQETARPTSEISSITNVQEMKRAELRGEKYTVSDEQVVKAIERAIKAMQGKTTNLEFSIHEETKMIAVKVLNSETGEVIREIPPEKTLDFVAKLWEMAGIMIDEKR